MFPQHEKLYEYMAHEWCDTEHPDCLEICGETFRELVTISPGQLNYSMVSFYLGKIIYLLLIEGLNFVAFYTDHMPAGTSTSVLGK